MQQFFDYVIGNVKVCFSFFNPLKIAPFLDKRLPIPCLQWGCGYGSFSLDTDTVGYFQVCNYLGDSWFIEQVTAAHPTATVSIL